MSELAINQYGEAFAPPAEAAHWLVRRMNDNKHGGPMQTFGLNGRPILLPVGASLADFQAALRGNDCPAGRYRLDSLDAAGRVIPKAPIAYLPYPPDRPTTPIGDGRDLPRNGNHAPAPGAAPWPGAAAPLAWSTGGAYPLPTPAHLTGTEYLLGEALRAQTAMLATLAESNARISAQQAELLHAAAELVRAADGAKLPARKPAAQAHAPAPQVIVQQVPVYPPDDGDDDDGGDDAPAPPPPPPPPAPPAWHAKVGLVADQILPVVQMAIGSKLAEMMGGGAAPAAVGVPRNAAPEPEVEPEPEAEVEPEPDIAPAAWSHLGVVVRRLGPAWQRRIEAQLARMTAEERHAFACSLVSLSISAASDHVVGAVAVAEQRQAAAAMAARPVAPAAPEAAPAVAAAPINTPTAAPVDTSPAEAEATAFPSHASVDDPFAPTEADLPVPTPASGPAVLRVAREMFNAGMADAAAQAAGYPPALPRHAAPAPAPAAPAPAAPTGPSQIAMMYQDLIDERGTYSSLLAGIPGGAATVEAMATQLLGEDGVRQVEAALAAAPMPPALAALTTATSAKPAPTGKAAPAAKAAPTAKAAPVAPAVELTDPAVMARMNEVLAQLTPIEKSTAFKIATSLPANERAGFLANLLAAPLATAVEIVRDTIAKYDAHGRPFG